MLMDIARVQLADEQPRLECGVRQDNCRNFTGGGLPWAMPSRQKSGRASAITRLFSVGEALHTDSPQSAVQGAPRAVSAQFRE